MSVGVQKESRHRNIDFKSGLVVLFDEEILHFFLSLGHYFDRPVAEKRLL